MNAEPIIATLPGERFDFSKNPDTDPHTKTLEKVEEVNPDLIIYMGSAAGPYFARADVLNQIKAPIIHFCCDASCPGWDRGIMYYRETTPFAFTVNIDGNDNWLKGPRDLTMWCPLDPSFYRPLPKVINFGWAGGLGPEREQMISELADLIELFPRNEEYGSYHEYADFLSSCKITLNMAKSGSGLSLQTKNRVREAGYAKCLLLEERGAPTSNWFELGEDYLDYGSSAEAREIVTRVSDSMIDRISTNLQQKSLTLYSPKIFWDKVLSNL
jgi:hypothetical protein